MTLGSRTSRTGLRHTGIVTLRPILRAESRKVVGSEHRPDLTAEWLAQALRAFDAVPHMIAQRASARKRNLCGDTVLDEHVEVRFPDEAVCVADGQMGDLMREGDTHMSRPQMPWLDTPGISPPASRSAAGSQMSSLVTSSPRRLVASSPTLTL